MKTFYSSIQPVGLILCVAAVVSFLCAILMESLEPVAGIIALWSTNIGCFGFLLFCVSHIGSIVMEIRQDFRDEIRDRTMTEAVRVVNENQKLIRPPRDS